MLKSVYSVFSGKSVSAILARGISASALIMITGKVLSYATNILFVRLSSPAEYGSYVYLMAWIGIVAVISRLGLDTVLLRFVPKYHVEQNWPLLKGIILKCHILVSQILFLGCLLALLLYSLGIVDFERFGISQILLALLMVWMLSNITLLQSSMRALGALSSALIPDMILRPMVMVLLAGVTFYLSSRLNFTDLLLVNGAGLLLTVVFMAVFFVNQIPDQCKNIEYRYNTREWLRVGFPFLLLSGINLIMNRTDIIMVGLFLQPEDIAIYSACVDLTSIVLFALTATSMVMVPMLSRLFSSEDFDEIRLVMKRSTQGLAVLAVISFCALVLFGKTLLNFYDKTFVEGYNALLILSFGFSVNVAVGMVGALLNMGGKERLVTATVAFCGVLNVLLNYLFIPEYGLQGAALATAFSMIVWNIVLFGYVNFKFLPSLGQNSEMVVK